MQFRIPGTQLGTHPKSSWTRPGLTWRDFGKAKRKRKRKNKRYESVRKIVCKPNKVAPRPSTFLILLVNSTRAPQTSYVVIQDLWYGGLGAPSKYIFHCDSLLITASSIGNCLNGLSFRPNHPDETYPESQTMEIEAVVPICQLYSCSLAAF